MKCFVLVKFKEFIWHLKIEISNFFVLIYFFLPILQVGPHVFQNFKIDTFCENYILNSQNFQKLQLDTSNLAQKFIIYKSGPKIITIIFFITLWKQKYIEMKSICLNGLKF